MRKKRQQTAVAICHNNFEFVSFNFGMDLQQTKSQERQRKTLLLLCYLRQGGEAQ
jgi:hypothetical protein